MSEHDSNPLPSFQKTKSTSSFGAMVLKSFALLGLLGLIFFGIYWGFGRIAFESHTRSELYGQVMRGQSDVRRMAGLEWATKLQSADSGADLESLRKYLPTEEETSVLAQELKSLESSAKPDVELISGIIGVLGHSYSARGQEALREFLRTGRTNEWSRAQVQAVIGLSRRSPEDPQTLEVLSSLVQTSEDPSLRKAIAYGLGFAGEGEPDTETWTKKSEILSILLRDSTPDVRWNAAFSAVRLGIGLEAATKQVADLIDELYRDLGVDLSKTREAELLQKRDTYLEALKLAQKIEATEPLFKKLWTQIKDIAEKHPDLKIRQGAKDALKSGG